MLGLTKDRLGAQNSSNAFFGNGKGFLANLIDLISIRRREGDRGTLSTVEAETMLEIRGFVQKLQCQPNPASLNFKILWAKVWPDDGEVLASYPVRLEYLDNRVVAECWVLTTKSLNYIQITTQEFRIKSYRLERYLCMDMGITWAAGDDSLPAVKKTVTKKRYNPDLFNFAEPAQGEYLQDYHNFIKQL